MADEKTNAKSMEAEDTGLKLDSSTNLVKRDMASLKDDGSSSKSVLGDATSSVKESSTVQELVAEQGANLPSINSYSYYYPGFDGTYPEWDNQKSYILSGDGLEVPYSGIQSDNGSMVYYMPGYNPYSSGTLMAVDTQCVGQQPYFPSSAYLSPPVSYRSEVVPSYSCDSTVNVGVFHNGEANADPKPNVSTPSSSSLKSRESNYIKTNGIVDKKISALPSDLNSRVSAASCGFSNSSSRGQPLKPSNKVPQQGSSFRSSGLPKGQDLVGKIPSFSNQGHGGMFPQNGFTNIRSDGQNWAGNGKLKIGEKLNRNGVFEASGEMKRGPRASRVKYPLSLSGEKGRLAPMIRRDQYNLKDFPTKYEQAMFFVIKSYSEDDVHKSIKYNVWASTPKGNEKLDATFRDAEKKMIEKGINCPIFLFFSVNASGQFIGLAEMIGQVDFKKSMDFWQQDKWNGFFPVKWHIIKDISNREFQHIILEYNDNKAVTYSRDTQEVRFPQGLQMLNIFKRYLAKTSILDDFSFYEDREKSKGSRHPLPPLVINSNTPKNLEATARKFEASTRAKGISTEAKPSLETLTKNLSLHPRTPKEGMTGKDSTMVQPLRSRKNT